MNSVKTIVGGALFAIFFFAVGLPAVFGSWYTVDQGQRVVVTRNGQVVDEAGPGLHWKTPYIDSIHAFDVKTDKIEYNKITGHTSDQQEIIDLTASVNYHVDPAHVQELYGRLGDKYADVKIVPTFLYEIGVQLGKVSAANLINNRDAVAAAITENLQKQLAPYGIIIETVQLQNPQFNAQFTQNINALVQQEVAVRTQQQALERQKIDAEIAVTKARGESDSQKATADGQAYTLLKNAQAEAEAIRIKGQSLVQNPLVIELTKAQQWDGKLPTTMVPGSTLPFLGPLGAK